MNCQEILTILQLYRGQVSKLLNVGAEEIEVSSAYSFISIKATELQIQFEVNNNSGSIYELYSPNPSVKTLIEGTKWPGFDSIPGTEQPGYKKFSEEVYKHLATADSIASLIINCARGDDYRPGNFSKIIYDGNKIELQQINHMNAKSLAHKKDYSLRSLIFKIDLNNSKEMMIDFNDHSSENNKHCGSQIQEAIDEYKKTLPK